MLFIYLMEDNEEFGSRVHTILRRMTDRKDVLLTSTLTVGELLAGTKTAIHADVEEMLEEPFIEVVSFDLSAARQFAEIRRLHRVSSADAVHLSCAAQARADVFLTNDYKLVGKSISGIQFVAGLDVNLF
jgi:predicted nucleic acid-binding protein